jgi:hypothetical protein
VGAVRRDEPYEIVCLPLSSFQPKPDMDWRRLSSPKQEKQNVSYFYPESVSRFPACPIGYCIDTLDLFMSKAVANRDKDRDFNTALLVHGFVREEEALKMVSRLP